MNIPYMGPMNGPAVGVILKEVVRRAINAIRNARTGFEISIKEGYTGSMDDVFTNADTQAQEIYLRLLQECFPCCGIVAEEGKLCISPKEGCAAYFTIDPLDGTKAFIRRQSHGVGTMIALVDHGEVICAYIADINTGEIFGYRPDSEKVHRISSLDTFELLPTNPAKELKNSFALLRDPIAKYGKLTNRTISEVFENHSCDGGSIGLWTARLWKGEVEAVFMLPGMETPWDSSPLIGISLKLGYVFLRSDGQRWTEYQPQLSQTTYLRDHETMIVHHDHLPFLQDLGLLTR